MKNGKSVDTDLIVIGGGPAGSAAAIWAGLNNMNVIIIESHRFPRPKPGETLHPGVEVIFRQLGVVDEINKLNPLRHSGILLKNQSLINLSEYGEDDKGKWKGYQILRQDLDLVLLNKLRSLNNVRIIQPCKATRVLKNVDRVIGVETTEGIFTSKFLIDASGGRKWLSRQLKLENTIFSQSLFARYGYQEKYDLDLNLPIFEFIANGWIWKAKIADNLFHWTRLSIGIGSYKRDNNQEIMASGTNTKMAEVTWRFNFECAANGYFICGDSCATLDPSGAKGVIRALYSGVLAADIITKILRNEIGENHGYYSYKNTMESWFMHDKRNLESFYKEQGLDISL